MSHLDDGMLHTYLDGELGPAGEAMLREHLATCADCRSRLDQARATRTRAHEILRYADPVAIEQPDFAAVLARRSAQAAASTTEPPRRSAAVRPLLLPWAASVILALGAGWFAQSLLTDAGGGGERVATMQSEESAAAPAADDGGPSGFSERPQAFSTEAAEPPSAPPPAPEQEAPLAAATAEEDAPEAGAPAVARDLGVGRAGGEVGAVPLRARGGADLSRAADARAEVAVADAPVTSGAAQAKVDADAAEGAAMQAAAPPPAAANQPAPPPAGWPTGWQTVDASGAAEALGEAPVVIADLPVEAYQVSSDGSGAVRVFQRLPGQELLELLQRRAPGSPSGMEIVVRAEVSADSLQRLREAVR